MQAVPLPHMGHAGAGRNGEVYRRSLCANKNERIEWEDQAMAIASCRRGVGCHVRRMLPVRRVRRYRSSGDNTVRLA